MNNSKDANFSVAELSRTQLTEGLLGDLTAWRIIQVFAYYVMILFSLVGNTVVIKAIRRIGRTLRRQVHYLFIVNLSVADLLFAVENIPMVCTHLLMNGAWKVEGRFGGFLCQFDLFLSLILILTSNLTILAIAIERFCGIFFPMKTFVSKKRAYAIVASTWILGAIYALPLFSSSFAYLVKHPDGNFRCRLCVECAEVIRWFIFQIALLSTALVTTLALYSAIGIKIWLGKTPGIQLNEFQLKAQAKKLKALKMLAMLVIVFYISFVPFGIYQLSVYLGFHLKLGPYYGQISAFLMYCNGALNPLIYSIYNLDIRAEFKALLTCKKPLERSRSSVVTFNTKRRFKDIELRMLSRQSPDVKVRTNVRPPSRKTGRAGIVGVKNAGFVYEDTRL